MDWLYRENKQFLFLTNNSGKTPRELQDKLSRMGLEVDEQHFYTSALATAEFISAQAPGAKAYVIGEPGLYNALYDRGITLSDVNPDYVVIGESPNYNYDSICKAVHLVQRGARLIGCNSDLTGGLKLLGVHSQDAAIIGDRMDTDIVAGIESGLDTLLVLSGVTSREELERFPYRPRLVLSGVGEIPPAP